VWFVFPLLQLALVCWIIVDCCCTLCPWFWLGYCWLCIYLLLYWFRFIYCPCDYLGVHCTLCYVITTLAYWLVSYGNIVPSYSHCLPCITVVIVLTAMANPYCVLWLLCYVDYTFVFRLLLYCLQPCIVFVHVVVDCTLVVFTPPIYLLSSFIVICCLLLYVDSHIHTLCCLPCPYISLILPVDCDVVHCCLPVVHTFVVTLPHSLWFCCCLPSHCCTFVALVFDLALRIVIAPHIVVVAYVAPVTFTIYIYYICICWFIAIYSVIVTFTVDIVTLYYLVIPYCIMIDSYIPVVITFTDVLLFTIGWLLHWYLLLLCPPFTDCWLFIITHYHWFGRCWPIVIGYLPGLPFIADRSHC